MWIKGKKEKMRWAGIVLLVVSCWLVFSQDDHDTHDDHDDHADHEETNSVKLTNQQMQEFGVMTEHITAGYLEKTIELPGEIVLNGDKIVHFVPRFSGVVKKIYKYIGDKVKKGDILAVIESNKSFQNYSVQSKISGIVIEKHLSLGEIVGQDSRIYVVADLNTVWVNLNAYQQDIDYLKAGQKVVITTNKNNASMTTHIKYISPIFDDKTRTALVRLEIKNKRHQWRPGMFITGKVFTEKIHVPLLCARGAIQIINHLPHVFIMENGKFIALAVELGRRDERNVEVTAGLKKGQIYVKAGAFTLKADLGKSLLSDGHNH